jgi:single-strand selective monofunctional uracil DNA glycosylase
MQVPFGVTHLVQDWLKIIGNVGKPIPEHPKRPITGFNCMKKEVRNISFF